MRKIRVVGTAALPQDKEIFLPLYASNGISCFTKRHQAFEAGFERVAVAKIPPCLSLDFGVNDGAVLSRFARLQTSPSPQKLLVLKFPIWPSRLRKCPIVWCRWTNGSLTKGERSSRGFLEIGTNDLPKFGPEILGSAIEDSVTYLRVNLKVRVVCVCNVIPTGNSYCHIPSFNNRVRTLHYSEFFAGSPQGFYKSLARPFLFRRR